MLNQEETLMMMYTQRQTLIKQLVELDWVIKSLESELSQNLPLSIKSPSMLDSQEASSTEGANIGSNGVGTHSSEREKVQHLIARCTHSANGLREAMKIVDACKVIQDNLTGVTKPGETSEGITSLTPEELTSLAQKIKYRDLFVHQAIVQANKLACCPDGCEFVQHLISILTTGNVKAELNAPSSYSRLVATHNQSLRKNSNDNASNSNNINTTTTTTTDNAQNSCEAGSATGDEDATWQLSNLGSEQPSELLLLLECLSMDFETIACDTCGARVSQRIADALTTIEEFHAFAKLVSPSIPMLSTDMNGTHTITKLLTSAKLIRFSAQEDNDDGNRAVCKRGDEESHNSRSLNDADGKASDKGGSGGDGGEGGVYGPVSELLTETHRYIFERLSNHCIDICKNKQGCCIIQKCMVWAPEPYHTLVVNTVLNNALKLVQDPFGNYVIQFILERQRSSTAGGHKMNAIKSHTYTNQIIRQMLHHVAELSCNKFSSNVIEKCLKTASPEVRQLLVDELTDPQVLPKLLTDSFANYVIQTAIVTASDEAQFVQLRDSILPLQNLLRNSPYGIKIEAKLSRRSRESCRRQHKHECTTSSAISSATQSSSLTTPSRRNMKSPAVSDNMYNANFIANMQSSSMTMMPSGGAMQQQVAFAASAQPPHLPPPPMHSITPDMTSIFSQQPVMNSIPFMLQYQQSMIGVPNSAPMSQYAMGMMSPHNLMPTEYR